MTKKKKTKQKRSGLSAARNRIRGLIGSLRSREFSKEPTDKALRYHSGFLKVLIEARRQIATGQYGQYLQWQDKQISAQIGALKDQPLSYQLLQTAFKAQPLPLEQELIWVASRLALESQRITDYRRMVDAIERSVWEFDYESTKNNLSNLEKTFGQSLWLIEIKIALEQLFNGLEAQKLLSNEIKAQAPKGISAYLAHYFSVRNEPTTLVTRFTSEMTARIQELDISESLATYLIFKLTWTHPKTRVGLGEILQVAQSNSTIDTYEVFLSVIQHAISTNRFPDLLPSIVAATDRLSGIDDFRLWKIRLSLGIEVDPTCFKKRDHRSREALLSGNASRSLWESCRRLHCLEFDPFNLISAALSYEQKTNLTGKDIATVSWKQLIRFMSVFYQRTDESFDSAFNVISKLLLSLNCLPSALSALNLALLDTAVTKERERYSLLQGSLHSCYLGVEDIRVAIDSHKISYVDRLVQVCEEDAYLAFSMARLGRGSPPANLGVNAEALLKIDGLNRDGLDKELLKYVDELPDDPPRVLRAHAELVAIRSAIAKQDAALVIDRVVDGYLYHDLPITLLPIEELLGDARWRDLEPYADRITLSIILDMYGRAVNDEAIATQRRFAYDEFLTRIDVQLPSQLATKKGQIKDKHLIYFLRKICVPAVMEISLSLSGSRQLEEERERICSLLCEIDERRKSIYQDEIVNIQHNLLVQDGLRVVDRSRIHVDTDAINKTAVRELGQDFLRYKMLVSIGIGVAEKFDVVWREALNPNLSPRLQLEPPKNEADEILLEMIFSLRQKFLNDSTNGLDSYLSKRVRHQSMSGYLRGPLEEFSLITQKDAQTGRYKRNMTWLSRLTDLSEAEKNNVAKCFDAFADDFDKTLSKLKEELFHIASPDHPRGIFDITLSMPAFHIARSGIQTDLTMDGFSKSCWALFWALLNPSLTRAREILLVDTKNSVAGAFERLRAGLSKVSAHDRRFPELVAAIQSASMRLQHEIERTADWFNRTEMEQSTRVYSFDEIIDIAVKSALSAHRSFSPIITRDLDSSLKLRAQGLLIITDLLMLALGNVCDHSNIEKSPAILITAHHLVEENALALSVKSQVKKGTRTPEVEQKLDKIRKEIRDSTYIDRVRKEGNSGFNKMASVVYQSDTGRLDFGFVCDEEFLVELRFSFFTQPELMPT